LDVMGKKIIINVLIFSVFGCNTNSNKNKTNTFKNKQKQVMFQNSDSLVKIYKPTRTEIKEIVQVVNDTNYSFNFKNYKQYKLSDTIKIDINRNGIIDEIFFKKTDSCSTILIKEKGVKLLSVGCENDDLDYPDIVDWVKVWCVVNDKSTRKVLFLENGDIDKDTIVKIKGPSIYLEKIEVGGGLITYKNGKICWIHQSD